MTNPEFVGEKKTRIHQKNYKKSQKKETETVHYEEDDIEEDASECVGCTGK